MEKKSDDFVIWAESILKTARRKLKKYKFDMGGWGFSEYVGKSTIAWLEEMKLNSEKGDSELVSI